MKKRSRRRNMAPKRRECAMTKKSCPKPAPVPKLIIKGGIEVLNIETGPDAITEIEAFLNPRMGRNGGAADEWYGYSAPVEHVGVGWQNDTTITAQEVPTYSCARINLPILNDDITCASLQMWEAVSVKTEVVGVNSLVYVHGPSKRVEGGQGIGQPVEGINMHFFAVGGEPLELQAVQANYRTTYPEGLVTTETETKKKPTAKVQGLDPTLKAVLDKDGKYPVEIWGPDPSKNENSRYFGSYTGGTNTPPVLTYTNTVTTVLLDENGVGPLCKGDGLFISAVDICGFFTSTSANNEMMWRGLPRYFKVTLRKRNVKNPYPVTQLMSSMFSSLMPKISGQPMEGPEAQIEEVRVYEGTEGVPADPDLIRYIDQFGQRKTNIPSN
ncbi:VP1 [Myocastor coypus polyomavirus 1]|uniref:VP1 n=1 Tax=Myocastor coypus polyomavirus 1 TaxID=2304056 RepID=UPI000E96A11D|nr:VP1 [Myocastor coypus polyomavirus 1]AXS76441.1 VP1 [Myocastor coypus polyomavirus 1]